MTEERIAQLRDRADTAYALHMDDHVSLNAAYPDLPHDYYCDVTELLDEHADMRRAAQEARNLLDTIRREHANHRLSKTTMRALNDQCALLQRALNRVEL